jgi:hypothetical protein
MAARPRLRRIRVMLRKDGTNVANDPWILRVRHMLAYFEILVIRQSGLLYGNEHE